MWGTRKKAFVVFSKGNMVRSFLGKEANGKVHISNYKRNGRDMRIKIANDTATKDTQYFWLGLTMWLKNFLYLDLSHMCLKKNVTIADLSYLMANLWGKNWWNINKFLATGITEHEFHFLAWAGLPELQRGKYLFSTLQFESPRWLSVSPECCIKCHRHSRTSGEAANEEQSPFSVLSIITEELQPGV